LNKKETLSNMKNMTKYLILILAISVFGCSTKKDAIIEKKAIIAGKILNQDKYPDNYTIKVFENNLVNSMGNYHTAFIENNGTFKITFKKSFKSDVYLIYGKMVTLFVGPGDSIFVEFDANEFLDKDSKDFYKMETLKFEGNNKQFNEEIKRFQYQIYNNQIFLEAAENEGTMLPEEFRSYLEKRKFNNIQLLDSLIHKDGLSSDFIEWANLSIKYRFGMELFHYTWYYPFKNNNGKKFFEVIDIPNSFYQAIKEISLNNEDAIKCSYFNNFIHEYYMTNTYYNSSFFQKDQETKGKFRMTESFQPEFEKLIQHIKKDFKGVALEILLSQRIYDLLDSYKRIDIFEKLYPVYKGQLRSGFCKIIDEKYSELKLKEQNPIKNESLSKQSNNIETVANNVLDEIIEKNKGKVLYIDFWATWCGPCLMEFENSKSVAKIFENKNIEFVYLCVKSEKENWEEKLREYKLTGSQYLLNDSEYDILSQKFQVVGIPHYVLIDKNGKVIDGNAPHPSNRDELINLINKYLD